MLDRACTGRCPRAGLRARPRAEGEDLPLGAWEDHLAPLLSQRDTTTFSEVFTFLGIDVSKRNGQVSKEIASCMRGLGWEKIAPTWKEKQEGKGTIWRKKPGRVERV